MIKLLLTVETGERGDYLYKVWQDGRVVATRTSDKRNNVCCYVIRMPTYGERKEVFFVDKMFTSTEAAKAWDGWKKISTMYGIAFIKL